MEEKRDTKILTVAGKGGVGKTSISSAMVRILTEEYPDARILAIDADPAIGLTTALGVEPTDTLDGIRKKIVSSVEDGHPKEAIEMLNEARFRIFDTMLEEQKFSFLAIGRPEAAGCYCAINTYLKQVIALLAESFDYIVIDGEAGIEQINRRVMEKVTHLICVSDQSKKGLAIVGSIREVAEKMVLFDRIGLIVNRAPQPERLSGDKGGGCIEGVPLIAVIGQDDSILENDMEGRSIFELKEDAAILQGVRTALSRLDLL